MYITLESDYAIRIVSCLAEEKKRMDARSISEKTNVTLRFALKILRKLVAGNIIKSYKGTHGGYELARPLNEISLKDVIEIVEGEYAFSRCLEGSFCCTREKSTPCRFQMVFGEISQMVKEKLSTATFDKLV